MPNVNFALVPKGKPLSLPEVQQTDDNVRQGLTSLYESFAVLYPNPQLAQERKERAELLKAVSAAEEARKTVPARSSSGILKFIFGDSSLPEVDDDNEDDDDESDDRLVYHEDNSKEDDHLLGTTHSLDSSCIPTEAHAMARFHLVSVRQYPTIARTGFEKAGTALITIVGLGMIVEHKQEATIQYTSDRLDLVSYCTRQEETFHACYARACLIGPNLLVVSWGLTDGHVVFYRRLTSGHAGKDWEAVASTGVTKKVTDALNEDVVFDENHVLLRVTDLVPTVVEQEGRIPAATVVVARLGGYMELVPLPHAMWYGPELSVSKKRQRQKRGHYTAGMPNLADHPQSIQVLDTTEYHSDLLALDAFRTSVEEDDVWDKSKYPDFPPAAYLLAATGTREGRETISFWSVCTVFKPVDKQKRDPLGFSVRGQLSEALDVGPAGPKVSVFASNKIMKHWRKPRRVELRPDVTAEKASSEKTNSKEALEERVTTVSFPAPLLRFRFFQQDAFNHAAALDWNGGVSVFDFALLERSVSHSLADSEYELLHDNADPDAVVPLVRKLNSRSNVIEQLASRGSLPSVSCMEWFGSPLVLSPRDRVPLVAVVTLQPKMLHLVDPGNPAGSPTSVPLPTSQPISMHRFHLQTSISFLSLSKEDSSISFGTLEQFEGQEIVRTLASENKVRRAIEASTSLGVSQDDLGDVIDSCRQKQWEVEHDFQSLGLIRDSRYVVEQALNFSSGDIDSDPFDLFSKVHSLALARLAKVPQRIGETLSLGGLEGVGKIISEIWDRLLKCGTYQLLCRYFEREPSFAVFSESGLSTAIPQLAEELARAGDVSALSIIFHRHRNACCRGNSTVLDNLPPTLDVATFRHLLPVASGPEFFLDDELIQRQVEEFPVVMKRMLDIDCVIDEEDGSQVLEYFRNHTSEGSEYDRREWLDQWYLDRLSRCNEFLGSRQLQQSFVDTAMLALDVETEKLKLENLSPAMRQLWTIQLQTRVQSEVSVDSESRDLLSGSIDVHNLDPIDLLQATIGEKTKSSDLANSYHKIFLPLMNQKRIAEQRQPEEVTPETFIFPLCYRSVETSDDVKSLLFAIAVSVGFVDSSRANMPRDQRLVKSRNMTMEFVLSIVPMLLEKCVELDIVRRDAFQVVDHLWAMYRSLPKPVSVPNDSKFSMLSKQVDILYRDLVALDIECRWIGARAFSMAYKLVRCDGNERSLVEKDFVSSICKTFCNQVHEIASVENEVATFVGDLLRDFQSFRQHAMFDDALICDVVSEDLLKPLLRRGEVTILAHLISHLEAEWVDRHLLREEMNVAVSMLLASDDFEESSSTHQEKIARLQTALGPLLNEGSTVTGLQKHVVAWSFINSVLVPSRRLSLNEVSDKNSLYLIAALLAENPQLSTHDVPQWDDPVWSAEANRQSREARVREQDPSTLVDASDIPSRESPPPSPGGAILHLASILEAENYEVACIHVVLAQSCVRIGKLGAAAAVCRAMLEVTDFQSIRDEACAVVATIVSSQNYEDISTKVELCEKYLSHSPRKLARSEALHRLLTKWGDMHSSRLGLEKRLMTPVTATAQLREETNMEYSVDLAALFLTLRRQTNDLCIDDELLNTLARYTFFWCIAQGTRGRKGGLVPFHVVSVCSTIALACSFLLHINNQNLRLRCSSEMHSTFEQQNHIGSQHLQTSLANNWVKPDEEFVQKLIGRGYSEFGARRAVMMTGNKGFDAAVQWAVMHTLDPDFDSPIVVLESTHEPKLDRNVTNMVSSVLDELKDGAIDSLRSFPKINGIKSRGQNVPKMESSDNETVSDRKSINGALPAADRATNPRKEVEKSERDPTKTVENASENKDTKNAEHDSRPVPASSDSPLPPAPSRLRTGTLRIPQKNKLRVDVKPLVSTVTEKAAAIKTATAKVIKDVSTAKPSSVFRSNKPSANPASRPAPPPPRRKLPKLDTSTDRSVLRERGEAALRTARSTSESPSRDDRRRLIEEGRRLLQKARGGTPTVGSGVCKNAPPPPPPRQSTIVTNLDNDESGEWDFDDDF